MASYSVLIIGAGRIGAFFDTPDSTAVLTHAHAFSKHNGFHLLGFVDADSIAAERASHMWGGEVFASLDDAFKRYVIDVVVIAAPDELHYSLLKEMADYPVRIVFAEKPLTKTLADAEEVVVLYRERGIALALNYTRRYVPEFSALRAEIASGLFGRFLTGTGYYGKGTLHNGSHMVDLLRFHLGDIGDSHTISGIDDYYADDPSCSAVLTLESGGQFFMQAVDCRYYTVFEIDLLFEKQRLRLVDAGLRIEIYDVQSSELFAGYRNLTMVSCRDTSLDHAFSHAAEHIYSYLSAGEPLVCTGEDGLRAQRVCMAIQGVL
jgi:predicted dehydrogenase